MKTETKRQLLDVLGTKIDELDSLDIGSEEHSRGTEDVTKLYKLIQDDEKQEWSIEESEIKANEDDKKYERELEKEKRDAKRSWIQFGITTTIAVLTTIGTNLAFKHRYHEGLEFEKTGTYTAKGGAQMIQRMFKPKTH